YKDFDKFDKTKLVKLLIKNALKLNENDLVIIKNGCILIKLYDESKQKQLTEDQINTEASRFNGINEKELEGLFKEYFTKDDIYEMLDDVAKSFITKYFIESKLSNIDYEQSGFKLIQKLIVYELKKDFEASENFYMGFAGYILRKEFKLTFKLIADYLLGELADSNENVLEFLEYYTNDIIVVNGIKYKVPELKASNGLKWHIISMISILKPYKKAQEYILDSNLDIKDIQKRINSLYKDGYDPKKYNELNLTKYNLIEEKIELNDRRLSEIYDTLQILSEKTDTASLERELIILKQKRLKLKEEKAKTKRKRIPNSVIATYEKLLSEKENIQKDIRTKSRTIIQNKKSYESIRDSLAKSLMSKKQPLPESKVI
ncbi:MAG: hypothetical protein JXQ66_07395, partial [Campylobacterales bacterium]|nr:hypothetical protein [Campylobacterales bacterium]